MTGEVWMPTELRVGIYEPEWR